MKRREPLPDLSHVLEDSARLRKPPPIAATPTPVAAPASREKRVHNRFDKAFPVRIGSELYGDASAIARNISAGGILVEMSYAPPLGTIVTVHFQHEVAEDEVIELVARAEVKHHHYLNFSAGEHAASSRAIGLRFIEFLDVDQPIAIDRLH